ncbi:MAG: MFS transporter [Clostridium sp.]|uniref:MFS transporter n=1 Tax=Clostridium sp. TaxID=1506 RepID=UPI003028E095
MKINKYILYIISFLQGLVFYGAFSVIFRESRGLELSHIFLLESIFLIIMMFFEIPWGIIADKIGYKKTLVISYGLFLTSKVIFYFSYSFLGFLMEAIVSAIAISGISGCDSAMLYSSINNDDSDKVFGIYGAAGTAGLLVASLVSGVLVNVSLDLVAFATIIPYTIAFLISMGLKNVENANTGEKEEENGDVKSSIMNSVKIAFENKKIVAFVVGVAVLGETTHSICVFLNQPLYIKSGVDIKWFGILLALMQSATFISIRAYKIKKKIGEKKLFNGALLLVIICNVFLLISDISYITITLIFIIEGAFALTQPITETIKNESIESINRATILSAYAMIGNVVASLSNIIIAAASRISVEGALICCLLINIIAIIPMGLYFKNKSV